MGRFLQILGISSRICVPNPQNYSIFPVRLTALWALDPQDILQNGQTLLFFGSAALLLLLSLVYASGMVQFAVGLIRVRNPHQHATQDTPWPEVTVLVPARNEEKGIEACVRSILASDYPGAFEVIVIDDFSEDATASIVKALEYEDARVRYISMERYADSWEFSHKGLAQVAGMHHAHTPIVLTTDADCTVSPGWMRAMAAMFADPHVAMVAGPYQLETRGTIWGTIQALEVAGLNGIAAGGIGIGWPNMCSGANLGYRRKVFEAFRFVTRAQDPTPWDDELLLQKILDYPPLKIAYCTAREAIVKTPAEPTLRDFFLQRMRWAATGARYPSASLYGYLMATLTFYIVLLATTVALFWVPTFWPFVALAFGLKVISEAVLLLPANRTFGEPRWAWWFLPAQLLQIPYVMGVGFLGKLRRPAWKGRTTW